MKNKAFLVLLPPPPYLLLQNKKKKCYSVAAVSSCSLWHFKN